LTEAEFGKNGRISAWPKPKPKFGATLLKTLWWYLYHFRSYRVDRHPNKHKQTLLQTIPPTLHGW